MELAFQREPAVFKMKGFAVVSTTLFLVVYVVVMVLFTGGTYAQMSPHLSNSEISCRDCHDFSTISGVLQINVPRGDEQEEVCKRCHNPDGQASTMHLVGNHLVNDGNTVIDCTTCHDPHAYQISTNPRGNTVTRENRKLIRSEIPEDRVPGVQNPIVYHIPEQMAVTTPPYTGACQGCHTVTEIWRNDGSILGHGHDVTCTACHEHDKGFIARQYVPYRICLKCHGERELELLCRSCIFVGDPCTIVRNGTELIPGTYDCQLKCVDNLKVEGFRRNGTCDVNQDENFPDPLDPDPDLNCEEFDYDDYDCSQ